MNTLRPQNKTPQLKLETVNHGKFNLHEASADSDKFHVLLFYRGLHCPVCKSQLTQWTNKLKDFKDAGADLTAISMDTRERAEQSVAEWDIDKLRVAYGLKAEHVGQWGLYLSSGMTESKTSTGVYEPEVFSEPGIFILKPDSTLYASNVQTMPFARPDADEIIKALKFIDSKNYPARGELEVKELQYA